MVCMLDGYMPPEERVIVEWGSKIQSCWLWAVVAGSADMVEVLRALALKQMLLCRLRSCRASRRHCQPLG